MQMTYPDGNAFPAGQLVPPQVPNGMAGLQPGDWATEQSNQQIKEAAKGNAHVSLDEAIARLESDIRADHGKGRLDRDTSLMALAALARTRDNNRKRKYKRFGFWLFSILLLCAGFFITKGYVAEHTVVGTHVTTNECSIPFGNGRLELSRHFTYPSKTLFGYQLLDKSHPEIRDEIKLPGDAITILGADHRQTEKNPKGKWWRENYTKGEFGTRKLKYADQIWFVGEKDKTALINRETFCN